MQLPSMMPVTALSYCEGCECTLQVINNPDNWPLALEESGRTWCISSRYTFPVQSMLFCGGSKSDVQIGHPGLSLVAAGLVLWQLG